MTDSTQQIVQVAAVLVVGGSQALLDVVRRSARGLQGTEVDSCPVAQAPTRAAELRPFAIVVSDDVYDFDAREFDALARDVHAELITVAHDAHGVPRAPDELGRTIARAFERRRRKR